MQVLFAVCLASILSLLTAINVFAQSVTISWSTTYQTIDGFGVSNHADDTALSSSQAQFLFGTAPGSLGFSILRIAVTEDGSCTSISSPCAATPDYSSDITAAYGYGAKVYAVPWTPPAIYKTNGNIACTAGSGNGALNSGDYAAYATYLSNFIASVKQYLGAPIYALSVQNEPSACTYYDSALWSASQIDTFVKNELGPTLNANGQSSTLIDAPESNGYDNFTSEAGSCMSDSSCSTYIGQASFHAYDWTSGYPTYSNPYSVHMWQTEVSDDTSYGYRTCSGYAFCPGIADALIWATNIDAVMSGGGSAWLWWEAIRGNAGNQGLWGGSSVPGNTLATRAYAMGQYSYFVRPGWVRMSVTHSPQSGVYITAYRNTGGTSFAIVAINTNTSATPAYTFSFSGAPTISDVTPVITSSSQNMATQSNVSASESSFTYSLPAQSVTTFSGETSSSVSPQKPAPPTGLNLTVQ
jgi:glucuronoarabinoxylan endo-1,4-beta-xylanase